MNSTFQGGPYDGETGALAMEFLSIDVPHSFSLRELGAVQIKGAQHLRVPGDGPRTRYVLGQIDDRKGLAHYYVPPSSSEPGSRK